MLKKITLAIIFLIVLLAIVMLAGPRPSFQMVDNIPVDTTYEPDEIDNIISQRESVVQFLKPDNEARIIWADQPGSLTEYSIVYLHGFSASQGEGYPLHLNVADSLNANLYLSRLPEHGLNNKDAMKNLSPRDLVESAKDAIAIGKSIGEKVILMGCSTGGTLAIFLAAGDPDIESLILISPNIEVRSSGSKMLTGPWGKELAYQLVGEHRSTRQNEAAKQYWSEQYHTNGIIAMQALLDQTMNEDVFRAIQVPVYCGYYYKDEETQDQVVSVEAMLAFRESLTIDQDDIEFDAFKKGNHVLSSVYKNENWAHVQNEILDFIENEIYKN